MALRVGPRMGGRWASPAQTSLHQARKAQSSNKDRCRFRKTSTKSCQALNSTFSLSRASNPLAYAFIGCSTDESEGTAEKSRGEAPRAVLVDLHLTLSLSNRSGLITCVSDLLG